MSTDKYRVFNDGGLQALVSQTKANKDAAGDNSAAIGELSTNLQQFSGQVADVLEEVDGCLDKLDTEKADKETVNNALAEKMDANADIDCGTF